MFGCGVFIDLQKAFDTVNHSILINKLEHYGIRGVGLDRFSRYLSNRKQYISVNGAISDYLDHNLWCSSRISAWPFAFLIYINDLPSISKVLSFYPFADDTNICLSSHDLFSLQKIMNRELKNV